MNSMMIAEVLPTATTLLGDTPAPAAASDAAAARFAELMSAPLKDSEAASARTAVSASVLPPNTPPTMGDAVLAGLHKVSDHMHGKFEKVQKVLGGPATVVDMLSLQAHMAMLSVEMELVGKISAKASQTIDTLVKQQ